MIPGPGTPYTAGWTKKKKKKNRTMGFFFVFFLIVVSQKLICSFNFDFGQTVRLTLDHSVIMIL